MKRVPGLAIALVIALVAVIAGRKLLGDRGTVEPSKVVRTGRAVPLTVNLADGLVQDGKLQCFELKRGDGSYSAVVDGGRVRNATAASKNLRFALTIASINQTETVGKAFALEPSKTAGPFLVSSKSLAQPVDTCSLAIGSRDPAVDKIAAVRSAAAKAGCSGPDAHAVEGQDHIQPPKRATYATKPPTSGAHYASRDPLAPALTGVHGSPIQNEVQVHNLEHGQIGLQYRGAGRSAVEALTTATNANTREVFLAPYEDMTQVIAMTAWGVSVSCSAEPAGPDLTSLANAFIAAYQDHAPESVPGTPVR